MGEPRFWVDGEMKRRPGSVWPTFVTFSNGAVFGVVWNEWVGQDAAGVEDVPAWMVAGRRATSAESFMAGEV